MTATAEIKPAPVMNDFGLGDPTTLSITPTSKDEDGKKKSVPVSLAMMQGFALNANRNATARYSIGNTGLAAPTLGSGPKNQTAAAAKSGSKTSAKASSGKETKVDSLRSQLKSLGVDVEDYDFKELSEAEASRLLKEFKGVEGKDAKKQIAARIEGDLPEKKAKKKEGETKTAEAKASKEPDPEKEKTDET